MRLVKCAIILLLSACSTLVLEVQDKKLQGITDDVERAINAAAGSEIISQGKFGVEIKYETDPALIKLACGFCHYTKLTINEGCHEKYGDEIAKVILVHEIGHRLGLVHSENPDSVMYKRARAPGTSTLEKAAASLISELMRPLAPNEL
jgi:predicted Zn-dependent protease with MMP-like domain